MTETILLVQHGHAEAEAPEAETVNVGKTAAYLCRLAQIDAVISGPTDRCISTAKIIGDRARLVPVPDQRLIPVSGTLEAQVARLTEMIAQIITEHAGQTIVIVGHELSNQLLLAWALGMDLSRYRDLAQEPCSVTRMHHDAGRWSLQSMNEMAHLLSRPG